MVFTPSTYKAYMYEAYGPIEDIIQLKDVPSEALEPTHVRIKVLSTALNPADHLLAEGYGKIATGGSPSAEKPYRIGFDAAGVIAEVGGEVSDQFKIGDEVYAMAPFTRMCTLAEYITLEAQSVAIKPKSLDWVQTGAAPTISLTSYQAIVEHAKLQKGERILILGGSTSCGMFAIQHAKAIGAYVITTASTKKVDFLKSIGADQVIDYTTTKWNDVVAAHSLDVFFDCAIEPGSWDGDAQTVLKKDGGRFVTLKPGPPASAPKFGATHATVYCYPSGAQLMEISKLVDSGKVKVVVDSIYAFDKIMDAFTHLKTRQVLGKVVVRVQDE